MFDSPIPEIEDKITHALPPLPEVAFEVVDRAQIIDGTPLVKYSATEAGLAALKAELAGKTYDLKTTKGDAAARADRLRCVTLRTTLERRRKDFKAPALAYGKLIDTEAARITAEIEALEAPIDAQIKADEQRRAAEKAERERIEREAAERHAARLAAIAMYAARCREPDMTAARIAAGMQRLEDADLTDADNARAVELADARCRTIDTMRTLHAQAVAREQEAARQEAIRIENERRAAELAEAERRIAAEAEALRQQAAELAAREAAARAETERLAREAAESEQRQRDEAAADLLQDECRDLSIALASKPDAMQHAREAADAIVREAQIHTAATQAMQAEAQLIDQAAPLPPAEPAQAQTDEPADIKMATLCNDLGFAITEKFVRETLGVTPTCRDKRAILFTRTQRRQILAALVRHVQSLI